jgi:hypothetical protein
MNIREILNTGIERIESTAKVIMSNPQVIDTATKISNFVHDYYGICLAGVSLYLFFGAPLPFLFLSGAALGYWAADKRITINPGRIGIAMRDLFNTPQLEAISLLIPLVAKYLLHPAISILCAGTLAGRYISTMQSTPEIISTTPPTQDN